MGQWYILHLLSQPNMESHTRNFGLTGAGKGDKSRVTDAKAYRDNHAQIDWQHTKVTKTGPAYVNLVDCDKCGNRVNLLDARQTDLYHLLCPDCDKI